MAACICITCGEPFNQCPAKIAAGEAKYCSLECFHASVGYRRQVRAALPGTINEIVERTSVTADTVRDQLVGLQRRGECHAARLVHVPLAERGRGTPMMALVYEPGPGGDPDAPTAPRAQLAYFFRKAILAAMPGSQMQLVDRTGQSQGSMSRVVREMQAAGQCHIIRWRRAKAGPAYPVYAAGAGVDRPCRIVPFTSAERDERYKKKLERRGLLGQLRAREAVNQRAVTLRKRGDPLVNALFGRRPEHKEAS